MSKQTQPRTYVAPHQVYTGGALVDPGVPFTTMEPRGAQWEYADPKERAADEAARKGPHGDVDLDKLDISALKAVAASKGVDLGEAKSKADIITVIKAADEPAL